jgi:hypothetical protein
MLNDTNTNTMKTTRNEYGQYIGTYKGLEFIITYLPKFDEGDYAKWNGVIKYVSWGLSTQYEFNCLRKKDVVSGIQHIIDNKDQYGIK